MVGQAFYKMWLMSPQRDPSVGTTQSLTPRDSPVPGTSHTGPHHPLDASRKQTADPRVSARLRLITVATCCSVYPPLYPPVVFVSTVCQACELPL